MAGVLEFTLGLQVSDFLSKVGISSSAITSLTAVGETLHRMFEGVFSAIEQSSSLEHLSRRSGETAGNLFRLQQGLEAAGVSAGELPNMLFLMQKALGGVSETGESTVDVFHKLGLNIANLKRQGPAEAFGAIIASFSGLSQDSATKASSLIFGRMGAGSAVQLSRSAQEFREAFADSAKQGGIFQRIAKDADRLHDTLLGVKREVTGLFAGLAEGALPAIQAIGDKLNHLNLTQLGLNLGEQIMAAFEAVRLDRFGEYFKLTLQSATFDVANLFGKMLQDALDHKAGEPGFAEKSLNLGRMGIGLAGGGLHSLIGEIMGPLGAVDQHTGQSQIMSAMMAGRKTFGWAQSFMGALGDIGEAGEAGAMGAGANPYTAQLSKLVAALATSAAARNPADAGPGDRGGGRDINFGGGLIHRTEGNAFEKMGFAMGGAGGPVQDTARNTGRMVDLLMDIRGGLVNTHGQSDYTANAHAPM